MVLGVGRSIGSDSERSLAFANIKKAAEYYGVELSENSAEDLPPRPQRNRKANAAKGAATRKRTGVAKKAARKAGTTRKKTSR